MQFMTSLRKQNEKEHEGEGVEELKVSEQMRCSLRLGSALWSLQGTSWSGDAVGLGGHSAKLPSLSKSDGVKRKAQKDVKCAEKGV